MSIMNNKITKFENYREEDLLKILDAYYDDNVFLAMKFYKDFADNFNCTFNYFIGYIDNYELYTKYEIMTEFFEYNTTTDSQVLR